MIKTNVYFKKWLATRFRLQLCMIFAPLCLLPTLCFRFVHLKGYRTAPHDRSGTWFIVWLEVAKTRWGETQLIERKISAPHQVTLLGPWPLPNQTSCSSCCRSWWRRGTCCTRYISDEPSLIISVLHRGPHWELPSSERTDEGGGPALPVRPAEASSWGPGGGAKGSEGPAGLPLPQPLTLSQENQCRCRHCISLLMLHLDTSCIILG